MATSTMPILVTGAAGKVGGVGRRVVEMLRERDLPVRAMVRTEDARAQALRDIGAEVVVGDLTSVEDVARVVRGCRRIFFSMAVCAEYLEAAVAMAAALKQEGNTELLVNISQMTASQMSIDNQTHSPQQRYHWLAEQVFDWSGLPVVHVRPTVFLEHPFFTQMAAASIIKDGTIKLPFGNARTSPIAVEDVARVIETILDNPKSHVGNVYHLTGPRSQDMKAIAREYEQALNRKVTYIDMPFEQWKETELRKQQLPQHVYEHILTMAELHAANRYDRITNDVERITGKPSMNIAEYVTRNCVLFNAK